MIQEWAAVPFLVVFRSFQKGDPPHGTSGNYNFTLPPRLGDLRRARGEEEKGRLRVRLRRLHRLRPKALTVFAGGRRAQKIGY